ncbi:ATP-phosphoribosyltransferase/ regulatory subunit [Synechococcus sp. SYN20]|uniref:ATP phosphoribosyltransferase regulatory subunit n=1 Tax=Synechococcus sp. SYN20 TaxID=1050714 RepID=UPI001646F4AC|nr:ATP phosphoribosyltransferase regulatory subunit [Synechococcus sp. SYN20]QNJ26109.1 ATP-phosphoribosyltransferase/ regulatory subunit [Synechococcus sp. SYN20]
MALQPATGARDLNPKQVQQNQHLREQLATVYRHWGYDEVSPPQVERLDTLMAGGAIASHDVVRLVADDPLGLRPEMTASIARAACTRLKDRPRPLRLCACGTIFESRAAEEGGLCIEEKLHSGVELFGVKDLAAELELLTLLIEAMSALSLLEEHQPQLLIGHTALMELVLAPFEQPKRDDIRNCLIQYDRLGLEAMDLEATDLARLVMLLDCRGTPATILDRLAESFGSQPVLHELKRLFVHLSPLAQQQSLTLQLDPTFHPHHELYDGLVFQLVCQGVSAPVVIARGGRYDGLVERCGESEANAGGVGFSFCLDDIRDLPGSSSENPKLESTVLICWSDHSSLEKALLKQTSWHAQGQVAQCDLKPCSNREEAEQRLKTSGCNTIDWLSD